MIEIECRSSIDSDKNISKLTLIVVQHATELTYDSIRSLVFV